jgi:hypothetical protein
MGQSSSSLASQDGRLGGGSAAGSDTTVRHRLTYIVAMTVEMVRHRFATAEYFLMVDADILGKDDHVELIEGDIVEMPPIGQPSRGDPESHQQALQVRHRHRRRAGIPESYLAERA